MGDFMMTRRALFALVAAALPAEKPMRPQTPAADESWVYVVHEGNDTRIMAARFPLRLKHELLTLRLRPRQQLLLRGYLGVCGYAVRADGALACETIDMTPPGLRFHREAFTLASQWSEVEFEWKFDEFLKVVKLG
jgi:hypothetical protein